MLRHGVDQVITESGVVEGSAKAIFIETLDVPLDERDDFVREQCGGDSQL